MLAPWTSSLELDGRTHWLGPRHAHVEIEGDARNVVEALEPEIVEMGFFEASPTLAVEDSFGVPIVSDVVKSSHCIVGDWVVYWPRIEAFDPDERIFELLRRGLDVLIVGESMEGPHFGPWITSASEYAKYLRSANEWSSVRERRQLGFRGTPTSMDREWLRDPSAVRSSLRAAVDGRDVRHVAWLTDGRAMQIGRAPDLAHFDDRSRWMWSKGLCMAPVIDATPVGVVLASASAPCLGEAALETNGGKAFEAARAAVAAAAEAVERRAALDANGLRRLPGRRPSLSVRAFHPFGREWDEHAGDDDCELVTASDWFSGESVDVPLAHVAFPYTSSNRPTASYTSGLAAWVDLEGAVLRGARELYEREDFYPNFLMQSPGVRIAPPLRCADLVASLECHGHRVHLVRYGAELPVCIVHAFRTGPTGAMRASGSGDCVEDATLGALLELTQLIVAHAARDAASLDLAGQLEVSSSWRRPEIIAAIDDYLSAMPIAVPTPHPPDTAAKSFGKIRLDLARRGTRLLVVRLPTPCAGIEVARVLIPGFCQHQYPSDSDGGRRIRHPVFTHGVPV